MARKRVIDPEFWLDEEITSLDHSFRLFYIATWNFADDYGVIENSAKKLKAQIFPYEEIDAEKIIEKLIKINKLIPFEEDGKKYLFVRNWNKYQRVDRPSPTRNAEVPKSVFDEHSGSPRRVLDESSRPREEKRREVKLREEKRRDSITYLSSIPEEDLIEITESYEITKRQVQAKAEDLILYCQRVGKKYKDYKAFLLSAIRRDFGKRKPPTPRPPEKQGKPIPEDIKNQMKAIIEGKKV